MKRLLAITLSIIMFFSLCACGDNKESKIDCSNCGESISKDIVFCEHCGVAVNNADNQTRDNSNANLSSTESKTEETSKPTEISKPSTPTHTHSYGNETITKKTTCTEQGIKTFYCSSCSATKVENIDATGHKWEVATCVSPKKCSICSVTDGEKLEHLYSNNNCTSCGKEKITFNYSRLSLPVKVGYSDNYINITSVDMKFKNEQLYAILNFTVVGAIFKGSTHCNINFKLISYKGEQVFADKIHFMKIYYVGENYSHEKCILSWDEYLKLEEGEYYISISKW